MDPLEQVHSQIIHGRRVQKLAGKFSQCIPPQARVLDVGTGDGTLAAAINQRRGDLDFVGTEVSPREHCAVDVTPFDGVTLPFEDRSFDVVMFSDVLHHTADPLILLREATRVARRCIVIKDHLLKGLLAGLTLRFMDRVGNCRHGVPVPGNYWREAQWNESFRELQLCVHSKEVRLGLYPWYLNWWFGRSLHFIARLDKVSNVKPT
jgi:SAM-dependent methyltransferase